MFSKNDFKILSILKENGCTTELRSYTIKKLKELTGLSENKIRNTLNTFKLTGYVKEGALQHRAKTFYITEEGINKLKELLGND
ncbi:MAG: transcriptional regulator [Thermosipho sp. (in: Bacteria)]|nr:transcriptional regulator [Thermosipho sp. (in: thermotogales)]